MSSATSPREATAAVPVAWEVPSEGLFLKGRLSTSTEGSNPPPESSGHSGCRQYLLSLEDVLQRGYLTGLVGPEHLAQGACRHLTREAVDVDFLVFMLLAHRMVAFLQGPTEGERNHKSGMSPLFVPKHRKPPPSTCQLPVCQAASDSLFYLLGAQDQGS